MTSRWFILTYTCKVYCRKCQTWFAFSAQQNLKKGTLRFPQPSALSILILKIGYLDSATLTEKSKMWKQLASKTPLIGRWKLKTKLQPQRPFLNNCISFLFMYCLALCVSSCLFTIDIVMYITATADWACQIIAYLFGFNHSLVISSFYYIYFLLQNFLVISVLKIIYFIIADTTITLITNNNLLLLLWLLLFMLQ